MTDFKTAEFEKSSRELKAIDPAVFVQVMKAFFDNPNRPSFEVARSISGAESQRWGTVGIWWGYGAHAPVHADQFFYDWFKRASAADPHKIALSALLKDELKSRVENISVKGSAATDRDIEAIYRISIFSPSDLYKGEISSLLSPLLNARDPDEKLGRLVFALATYLPDSFEIADLDFVKEHMGRRDLAGLAMLELHVAFDTDRPLSARTLASSWNCFYENGLPPESKGWLRRIQNSFDEHVGAEVGPAMVVDHLSPDCASFVSNILVGRTHGFAGHASLRPAP